MPFKFSNKESPESEDDTFAFSHKLDCLDVLFKVQHCVPCALEVVVGVDHSRKDPKGLSLWDHESSQFNLGLSRVQELANDKDAGLARCFIGCVCVAKVVPL